MHDPSNNSAIYDVIKTVFFVDLLYIIYVFIVLASYAHFLKLSKPNLWKLTPRGGMS
jgi:hypothetical protein